MKERERIEQDLQARMTEEERKAPADVFEDRDFYPSEEEVGIEGGELEEMGLTEHHQPVNTHIKFYGRRGIAVPNSITTKQISKFNQYLEDNDLTSISKYHSREAKLLFFADYYPDQLQAFVGMIVPAGGKRGNWSVKRMDKIFEEFPYQEQAAQPAVSENVARQAREVLQQEEEHREVSEEEIEPPRQPVVVEEEEEEEGEELPRVYPPELEREEEVPQMWRGGAVYRRW